MKCFFVKIVVNQGLLLWSAVSLIPLTTKYSDLKAEYLGVFEFEVKTALTSGPGGGAQVE
jgi:hypothetical protein